MLTTRDVMVEAMRREERLRRVEYGRFVQSATNQNNPQRRLGLFVGRLLIKWGSNLQARCAARCGQPPTWQKAYHGQ